MKRKAFLLNLVSALRKMQCKKGAVIFSGNVLRMGELTGVDNPIKTVVEYLKVSDKPLIRRNHTNTIFWLTEHGKFANNLVMDFEITNDLKKLDGKVNVEYYNNEKYVLSD